MKNSKITLLFIFILFLALNACNTTTSNNEETDYAPGEVLISLVDGVIEADIKPRIEELGLEWKEYFENLGTALIGVLVGEEKLWVERLIEEPMIRNAHLNRKVEMRAQ